MKDGFLSKIASGVGGKKGRFITLGIWIIAIIVLQIFFPKAADYKDDAAKDLPSSEQQVSKDGTTLIQTVIMEDSATSDELTKSFNQLESAAKTTIGEDPFAEKVTASDKLVARTTGPAGISVDASGLFKDADVSLLIGTVLLVLVFLLVIYRSPILALIPLVAVGF
ncbi:MMPL family transporter, partial [Listeria welshimeri]|uniref:MMPL family transporter n=1 Tax=Listeria welshimeri TaxID=1643 RepID=UPI00188729F1